MFRAQLAGDRRHLGLRLFERHARSQPAEHGEEREVPWRRLLVIELQRLPDLRVLHEESLCRQEQPEILRHHAHDGVRHAIQLDRASDETGVATESPAPQVVAEHHDRRPLKHLFVRLELPAMHRSHAQQRKEIGRDGRHRHALRLAAATGHDARGADDVAAGGRGEALECLRTLLVVAKVHR